MALDSSASTTLPIAVVLPTRDTRELTLRCLASLENGTGRAEQVIVVDDGSTDGTVQAIAKRHPQVLVLRNEKAMGFSGAVNRGLAAARSSILLLLNSDTEVDPDCLQSFDRAFREEENLGLAGAALFDPDGTPQWSGGPTPSWSWLFAASSGLGRLRSALFPFRRSAPGPRRVDWVAGTALAMRREIWEVCGPLDERFALYCQDLDLCLRVGEAGWRLRLLPDCRVFHHHGYTIARMSGEQQDLEKLWCDLVRWTGKWRGDAAARRAAWVLRAGGFIRSLAMTAACGLTMGSRRLRLRRQLANVRRARRALRDAID